MGGGTVFPNQGIAVTPTKGSLVFWYNLDPSGGQFMESLHGACPTLYGIKWGKFFLGLADFGTRLDTLGLKKV